MVGSKTNYRIAKASSVFLSDIFIFFLVDSFLIFPPLLKFASSEYLYPIKVSIGSTFYIICPLEVPIQSDFCLQ